MKTQYELIKELQDESTRGHRGTILYDLKNFNCGGLIFPELINSIITGSFEEVQHAVEILDTVDSIFPTTMLDKAKSDLYAAYLNIDIADWRQLAISEVIEMFNNET